MRCMALRNTKYTTFSMSHSEITENCHSPWQPLSGSALTLEWPEVILAAAPTGLSPMPNTPSIMPCQRLREGIDMLSCQDLEAHHQCRSCWIYERVSGDVRAHMTRLSLTDRLLVVKPNVCLQKYPSVPEVSLRPRSIPPSQKNSSGCSLSIGYSVSI
jgi:hypothetical protein